MIDARGLSCPQPVIMFKKALSQKLDKYEVIVDNVTAKENITRFALHEGFTVQSSENNGEYTLEISR